MILKRPFLALLAVLFTVSCADQQDDQTISGTLTNAEGKKVSLVGFVNGEPDTLGSATLGAEGNFEIPINTGRLSFYNLVVEDNGAIVLAFDSTESPVVSADVDYINKKYEVSGSKDSERIRDVFVKSVKYETKLDSTMKILREATKNREREVRMEMSQINNETRKEYKQFLLDFIDEDTTSVANFSVLQRLDPKTDMAYYIKVRNGLEPRLKGNVFYDQLANNVSALENEQKQSAAISEGQPAPDIALPNPSGETVSLSSMKGKYVLVDFWASWCKPCRIENPNVVKLYNKYSKENFEILGVSLDKDKAKWEKAIADDNLAWPQVSDLKFWNSAAAQLYNVRSIPFTVLVNPEGEIEATKLRGRALEEKLADIYGY
ncbi:MAG: redoxin domain-containing protein [Cryomorphaceae bacterium]